MSQQGIGLEAQGSTGLEAQDSPGSQAQNNSGPQDQGNTRPQGQHSPASAAGPHVVIAPDSFKGSLSAADVASAMSRGVLAARPDARVSLLPMADGGEGTLEALASAWGVDLQTAQVVDAIGRPGLACWAVSPDGRMGVVELAQASGLPAVSDVPLQPLDAHTYGMGQLAAAVLDAGVDEVLVCLGGSASTDAGAGFVTALGVRILDAQGSQVPLGGRGLAQAAAIDITGLHPRAALVSWRMAVDVDNPLTGPRGAAAIFGPQKGASPADISLLDASLGHFAQLLEGHCGNPVASLPGTGAAGGVPAVLLALLGGEIEAGAALVSQAIGLPEAVRDADLVLTGEGRFDEQSIHGKVADGVAQAVAQAHGGVRAQENAPAREHIQTSADPQALGDTHTQSNDPARRRALASQRPPVVVIAGSVTLPAAQARAAGITAALSIAPGPIDLTTLLACTPQQLSHVAEQVTALSLPD